MTQNWQNKENLIVGLLRARVPTGNDLSIDEEGYDWEDPCEVAGKAAIYKLQCYDHVI